MYQRILLPTDGSDLARSAAAHGIALAKYVGAEVVAVSASPPFETPAGFEFVPAPLLPVDAYEDGAKAAAKRYLGELTALAANAGVSARCEHLRALSAADAIVACAKDQACDLIVIGSHGRGALRHLLLGSVTNRVLMLCTVPVLVHRAPDGA